MYTIILTVVILALRLDYIQPSRIEIFPDNNDPWDILIYTQEWPETVCREWVHNNPSHTCKFPKKEDSWAIHGIWPTKLHTRGPGFCNRTWLFDPEQIRPIENELIEKWTNIEDGTGQFSFLAHEWNKHGTCAAQLDAFNSQLKYFSMGLKWFEQYDMTAILASAGIVPNNEKEYSLMDFYNAVQSKLGTNPSIQCRFQDGKSYLVEIRICFDKNLSLYNCDDIGMYGTMQTIEGVNINTNCRDQGILYQHNKFPPENIYIQLLNLVTWLSWVTL